MNLYRVGARRRTMLVVLFLCIECFDEVIDGLSGAAWPLIRSDLNLSYTEIGLLFSVPALLAYVIEPVIGLLGDVWRRFTLIALGGIAYATALTMFAGAVNFAGLMAAMILLYPSSGTFVGLSQSSLMDVSAGDEERGMVIWTIAGNLGIAAGPLCLAGAIALGWSWRTAYLVLAGLALVVAVVLWLSRPPPVAVAAERLRPVAALRTAWEAARSPGVLRWLFLLAAIDLVLEVFVGFLALHLVDDVGFTATHAALALTIWTVSALIGEGLLILVLRRVDGLTIVRRGAVVVALLIPAFLLTSAAALKLGLIALMGLCTAGWYSILKAQFFRAMEGRTGVAMAFSSLFGPVQALVPAGVGLLAEHAGLSHALWVTLFAPIAVFVFLGRR